MLLLLTLTIIGLICVWVYSYAVRWYMYNAISNLPEINELDSKFFKLQTTNNCCGFVNSDDWLSSEYTYRTAKIPEVCCTQIGTDPTDCGNVYVWKKKKLKAENGCINVIKRVYYSTSAIAITFACFQAFTLQLGAFFYQLINGPLCKIQNTSKWNKILISMFSLVHSHLEIRILVSLL